MANPLSFHGGTHQETLLSNFSEVLTTRDKVDVHIRRRYQLAELAPEIPADSAYANDANLHAHLSHTKCA
jgi:hypothetical protein